MAITFKSIADFNSSDATMGQSEPAERSFGENYFKCAKRPSKNEGDKSLGPDQIGLSSAGSACHMVASLELKSAIDLKVMDIVTEEQEDCTVASIIVNQTVAREMALERDTSAKFIHHSNIIAHSMWQATKYICPEWNETEVEIGDKVYKILTAQMILPKSPKMLEYSYGDATFCKYV
eukprot:gene12307-13577_t